MSISAIGAVGGFQPMVPQSIAPTTTALSTPAVADPSKVATAADASGMDFGSVLAQGISNLQGLNDRTDQLAVKAATGDLNAIHDYTITATEATVATQLTTAVRNKALEAFQEIMRMSV